MTAEWLQWVLGIAVTGTIAFLTRLSYRMSTAEKNIAVLEEIAHASSEDREELKQMLQVAINGINDLTVSVAKIETREEERR